VGLCGEFALNSPSACSAQCTFTEIGALQCSPSGSCTCVDGFGQVEGDFPCSGEIRRTCSLQEYRDCGVLSVDCVHVVNDGIALPTLTPLAGRPTRTLAESHDWRILSTCHVTDR